MPIRLAYLYGILRAVPEDSDEMRRLKLAVAARKRAVAAETAAVLAAVQAGEKQVEVARVIGRSREHVRLLLRASENDD